MLSRIRTLIIVSLSLAASSVLAAQVQPHTASIALIDYGPTLLPSVPALYGSHWRVDASTDTELTLQNLDETRSTTARLTVYGEDGSVVGSKDLVLSARGRQIIAISSLMAPTESAVGGSGGFSVTWQDMTLSLVGSYLVEDAKTAGATQVDLVSMYVSDTESVLGTGWYLPDRTSNGELTLFNSSSRPAQVTASSGDPASAKNVFNTILAGHASVQVSLRDIVGEDAQGTGTVLVRYSGALHSVLPTLNVVSATGFTLSSHFFGVPSKATAHTDSLLFPQIAQPVSFVNPAGSQARTQLLLSNPTSTQMVPVGIAYLLDTKKHKTVSVPLTLNPLPPYSASLLDLNSNLAIESSEQLLGVSLTTSAGADLLGAEVFAVNEATSTTAQSVGEMAWSSGTALPWSLSSRVNLTPSLGASQSTMAAPALVYVNGAHLESYVVPGTSSAGTASPVSLAETFASRAPDANGVRLPQGLNQGFLLIAATPGLSVLTPRVCYTVCPQTAATSGVATPEIAMTASSGPIQPQEAPAGCQSTINLTRTNISQTSAVGKPQNGTFKYSVSALSGGTIATFTTSVASQNPNPATIGNTSNTGIPIQGGLAKLSATFTCSSAGTTSPAVTWNVATFGTSCYHLGDEGDWWIEGGSCKPLNLTHYNQHTYTGDTVDPSGFPPGVYCLSFVQDTAMQGSAHLDDGSYVYFTGVRNVKPDCPKTNCTFAQGQAGVQLIPDGTVASALNIVKRGTSIELATNTPGQSQTYLATDTGGTSSISRYRLDLYEGVGKAVCTGFRNDVRVASCTPNSAACPKWIQKP